MSNKTLSRTDYEQVIKYGSFYYPADKHYYPGSVVQCDRCDRTNLRTSIGFQDHDLCLTCADHVESLMTLSNPQPIRIGPPPPLTRPPVTRPTPFDVGRPHHIVRHSINQNSPSSEFWNTTLNNQNRESMDVQPESAEF